METKLLDSIKLEEMDQVKLMNRTDIKYWFHNRYLPQIFNKIQNDYFILEIKGESELPYATIYYETLNNNMFSEHHNGKLNRYKVRRRSFVKLGISFLEVKFKSNKGRSIKKRISTEFGKISFTPRENEFLSYHIPFDSRGLSPSLVNNFSRLTGGTKNKRTKNEKLQSNHHHSYLVNF